MKYNIIVILAGGLGLRYGNDIPKQYTVIAGKEVLQISIENMLMSNKADEVIVVVDSMDRIANLKDKYNVDWILGGSDRAHSFQNALDYIEKTYPECVNVCFHEAARPLVAGSVIDRYFELLDEYDYIETCKRITDSLGSYVENAPKREDYFLIQAPEAYRLEVLRQYFDCESDVYFAGNQMPPQCKRFLNFDLKNNIKLTNPEDKLLIEFFLHNGTIL